MEESDSQEVDVDSFAVAYQSPRRQLAASVPFTLLPVQSPSPVASVTTRCRVDGHVGRWNFAPATPNAGSTKKLRYLVSN